VHRQEAPSRLDAAAGHLAALRARGFIREEAKTASTQGRGSTGGEPGPAAARPRRYGLLLIILIATYMLSAFSTAAWISGLQLGLFAAAGLLALRDAPFRRHTVRLVVAAGLVLSVLMIVIGAFQDTSTSHGAASLWKGVLLLLTVILLVRQILMFPEVTIQSIYGAISAYLIIGLMFASFYAAMYYLFSEPFFSGHQQGSSSVFQYFSFTTLTTLGYGDYTAATSIGRAVAMLEAMTGQIFLATLVAKLVATFRPSAAAAAEVAAESAKATARGDGPASAEPGSPGR
jgi:hypothetical protein